MILYKRKNSGSLFPICKEEIESDILKVLFISMWDFVIFFFLLKIMFVLLSMYLYCRWWQLHEILRAVYNIEKNSFHRSRGVKVRGSGLSVVHKLRAHLHISRLVSEEGRDHYPCLIDKTDRVVPECWSRYGIYLA